MKLELGKYTEITNFAKEVNPALFKNYVKVWVCPDVENVWLATLSADTNSEYENCPGTFLLERDNVSYPDYDRCRPEYLTEDNIREIVEDWACETYDSYETSSVKEATDQIDGGWGIIPEGE